MASRDYFEKSDAQDELAQIVINLAESLISRLKRERNEEGIKTHEGVKCQICQTENFRGYRFFFNEIPSNGLFANSET